MDSSYGEVVFSNEWCVLRVRVEGNEVRVSAHNKNAQGQEEIPRGYMLGSNFLIKEKKNG